MLQKSCNFTGKIYFFNVTYMLTFYKITLFSKKHDMILVKFGLFKMIF